MPPLITADEWIQTADGLVVLATPACRLTDLSPLDSAAQLVGENERMPGAHGRRRFRRYRDQLEFALPGFVNGAFDFDGTEMPNPRQGLRDHLRYLGGALGQASSTDQSAIEIEWHQYDGTVLTAMAQWAGPFVGARISTYVRRISFDLVIPSGAWEEAP